MTRAYDTVKGQLAGDNGSRALSLHDDLMQEGWVCFDPAYAADRYTCTRQRGR